MDSFILLIKYLPVWIVFKAAVDISIIPIYSPYNGRKRRAK